jgi:hypothetical protein
MRNLKIARAGSHTNVMVVTGRGQIPLRRKIPVPTITMSGSLLPNCADAMVSGTPSNVSVVAPATRQIHIVAASINRDAVQWR